MALRNLRAGFERLLEIIVLALVSGLTLLVIAGAVFRYSGSSLAWYDEMASVGLVWLTYYGSALAALRGAHIGVPVVVNAMPPAARVGVTVFAEACVCFFFVLLAVLGWDVVLILEGEHMVSLPAVSLQITQSALPIAAVLFVVAEALRLPDVLREARGGGFVDRELKDALETIAESAAEDGAKAKGEAGP